MIVVTCTLTFRALTEIQHDVKEAREAIQEVVDDDKVLAAVCLSDADDKDAPELTAGGRQTPRMRLAAALLGSYERQIQSVEGSLRVGLPCCAVAVALNTALCQLTWHPLTVIHFPEP